MIHKRGEQFCEVCGSCNLKVHTTGYSTDLYQCQECDTLIEVEPEGNTK